MSGIKEAFGQYLDLRRAVAGNAPAPLDALNEAGEAALARIISDGRTPRAAIDAVSPETLFAPDYGVNINGVALPVDAAAAFRCGVPGLSSLLGIVANDAFVPTDTLLRNMPGGLTVCSLRKVPAHLADTAARALHYGLDEGGAPAALNAMLLSDGVFIHVDKGVHIDKAIQIVSISNPATPMLAVRRVVIVAEEDASVRVLLCDHSQPGSSAHLNSEVVNIMLGEGASVECYDIEEGSENSNRYRQIFTCQQERSSLVLNSTCLHGERSHTDCYVNVDGEHAETSLSGLSICGGSQVVDNNVLLRHNAPHCTSRQLFKNALFDKSRGGFGGRIIVAEGSVFTDAAQTNRNLLAGDDARMTTAPQLEIYCDEVKCSHGATTGQLDDRALFYMQTRGIPADEARRMLTQAFMNDVIENISFEVLRQRIHILVEKRLSGASGNCDTCATACHPQSDNQI